MASRSERFHITNGPSKLDLMLSLVDGDSAHRRPVLFHVKKEEFWVSIDSLEREDGSGESWNFTGRGRRYGSMVEGPIRGYFSSRNRSGQMFVEY